MGEVHDPRHVENHGQSGGNQKQRGCAGPAGQPLKKQRLHEDQAWGRNFRTKASDGMTEVPSM